MSDLAIHRFGLGTGPAAPAPVDPADQLDGRDAMAARHRAPAAEEGFAIVQRLRRARDTLPEGDPDLTAAREALGDAIAATQARALARALDSATPYRERLVRFWASHFSVTPRQWLWHLEAADRIEAAIRPHVTGRFADMLTEAVLHPSMLRYLQQWASVGPNSPRGRRGEAGLNENLARELLELHTIGVDAPYGQADVRATALVLTGHAVDQGLHVFDPRIAEPGVQTVLGRRYGGLIRGPNDAPALIADLAARPETAAHLARKLAIHFVADDPPEGLVADLAAEWRAGDGDLGRVARALAAHPLARDAPPTKIRPPSEFLIAALRALGVTGDEVLSWPRPKLYRLILSPQEAMGQPFTGPPGPDGWPETAAAWLTAPALAARIDWAMDAPARLRPDLPDARAFVARALGPERAAAETRLARLVGAAESNPEALGLVLSAPAFHRR